MTYLSDHRLEIMRVSLLLGLFLTRKRGVGSNLLVSKLLVSNLSTLVIFSDDREMKTVDVIRHGEFDSTACFRVKNNLIRHLIIWILHP